MLSRSSISLGGSDPELRVQDFESGVASPNQGTTRRRKSNASELSRIISGIREDIHLDEFHSQDYKSPPVEGALIEQFEQVSRKLTENSGVVSPIDEKSIVVSEKDTDHPVDGGFAFWQAFLAMLMVFLTWGANAAFGIFLNLYLHSPMFQGTSMYGFALMGGLVVCLANLLCPFTVLLVKIFGQTLVLMAGIVIQTAGYLLAAQCTQFWQLFLCQGFMVGLSFALIFIPGTLVIPTWFDKHMALAMGLAVSGAGLGGLVFSFILNLIILLTHDQKWALRATGLINLVISLFATVFMRVRNRKPINYKETLNVKFFTSACRIVFDVKIFKGYPLVISAIWFGIVLMGYVIVLYSMAPYATSEGLTAKQSTNVLAVLNALQVVGRPAVGRLGDYLGRNNTALLICCYAGIVLLAFWLHATDYASIMVLAALIGAPAGVGSTMAQSMAHDILKFEEIPHKLPAAWGGMNIIVSFFALPAEVIALKLKNGTAPGSFRHAQIFTSCAFFAGALLLVVNREWLVRQTLSSRRLEALETINTKQSYYLRIGNQERDENESEEADLEAAQGRVYRYDQLLGRSPVYFLVRAFYPIRV